MNINKHTANERTTDTVCVQASARLQDSIDSAKRAASTGAVSAQNGTL
jgi:hypothetical protein